MPSTTLSRTLPHSPFLTLLFAGGCLNDCNPPPETTTTADPVEHTTIATNTTAPDPDISTLANDCPTGTLFAFPHPDTGCPHPDSIVERVGVFSGKSLPDDPSAGIDHLVCRYSARTSPVPQSFLSDAEGVLQDAVAVTADCPVFQPQGWSPSVDQRRMRALQRMHRVAAGAGYDGSNFGTAPTAQVYVLDSVPSSHMEASAADMQKLLNKNAALPTSAHGLSVAATILDIACGESIACRQAAPLYHEQVLLSHDGLEALGYHNDLATGIYNAVTVGKPGQRLINISVADLKPLSADFSAWQTALSTAITPTAMKAALKPLQSAMGPARFAVFGALAIAWCRGVPVFAAAGNIPPTLDKPATAAASFPAVLEQLELPRPATFFCKYMDPKGTPGPLAEPATDPLVWAVGAADHQDRRLANSAGKNHVELLAHGLAIAAHNERTGFEVMTGTSGAAATVTAIVARALTVVPQADANQVVRKVLLKRGHPVADLCWVLTEVCADQPSPACAPYRNGAIQCATRPGIISELSKWNQALGAYVATISKDDRTISSDPGELRPQPGGQYCPRKYCGVFANTFVAHFDEHMTEGKLANLSLHDVDGNNLYSTSLSNLAITAGGSTTKEGVFAPGANVDWSKVTSAILSVTEEDGTMKPEGLSEIPVHN